MVRTVGKEDRPKVILVAPVAPPIGGMTRWTSLVESELQKQSVAYCTVSTSPKRRKLDGQSRLEQITGGLQNSIRAASSLIRCCFGSRARVIHISTSGGMSHLRDILLSVLGKMMGARVFLHLHHGRLPVVVEQRRLERVCIDILASLVETFILLDTYSEAAARKRWPKTLVQVIPNPVRVQISERETGFISQKSILYLGWITKEKGIGDLLKAWEDLAPSYPNWNMKLVGGVSDSYRNELAETYPSDRWLMEGEVSHGRAMKFLASSEILVLPSYSEGFPNVILEAMSLGKAVVATKVGAMAEMLAEGGGLLVTPGSLEELTEALSHLMADDNYRNQTGKKGYKRVIRDYDVSVIVSTYRQLWGV